MIRLFNDLELSSRIANLFSDGKSIIRLAVVGATSSGKTYLLTDIVGSLYRLGYEQKDHLENASPHHSVLELIDDVTDRQGGIRTTEVYACRAHNHYSSDFDGPDRLHLEFLDVPGEVMTPESIRMFHAVMKSLMACTEKMFTETTWRNKKTRKSVRLADFFQPASHDGQRGQQQSGPVLRDPRQARRQVVLGPATPPIPTADTSSEMWALAYMDSERRRDYYRQKGYEPVSNSRVSGRHLFQHFFEYDTDTLVNSIVDAWALLDIDERLSGGATGQSVSQRSLFNEVFKKHFYFHYYTFYATDVVVCDKCCVPLSAHLTSDSTDNFTQMMHSLVSLTSYAGMKQRKNWYLAFKGIDAILRQDPFRRLYEMSDRDINLTYSHFLMLFRQTCQYHMMAGKVPREYQKPFRDLADLKAMLAGDVAVGDDALDVCADHYETLSAEGASPLFAMNGEYTMTCNMPIDEHVRLRMSDFSQADPSRLRVYGHEGELLQMPPHVFFTATPIDNDFVIDGHDTRSNRAFGGVSRHYHHRAYFGALQLTTCILREHELCLPDGKMSEGKLLTYIYDVRY